MARERLVFRKQSYVLLKGRGPVQPRDLASQKILKDRLQ